MTTNNMVQLKSYDKNTGNEIGNVFPITSSAAVQVENDKNLKEKLTEITNKIDQTNASLDNIANKGTTVEVLERVTKQEIDKQIKDETITKEKLDPYIQFGIKNLSDNVITPIITNNTKAKVNLFNKNTGEPGYLVATTGFVRLSSMGSNDWTSDFIACTPGETITKDDKSSNAVNNQDVCFYNANKTYISGIVLKKDEHWQTFKIPAGAYYFRFDMWASHKDTEKIYANRGSDGSDNEDEKVANTINVKEKLTEITTKIEQINVTLNKIEQEDTPVITPIIDNILTLTTNKRQQAIIKNNTTIVLPVVNGFTQISLTFSTIEALTLILPRIKWQGDISIEAHTTYEFIFTYINNSWLGGCISYE